MVLISGNCVVAIADSMKCNSSVSMIIDFTCFVVEISLYVTRCRPCDVDSLPRPGL